MAPTTGAAAPAADKHVTASYAAQAVKRAVQGQTNQYSQRAEQMAQKIGGGCMGWEDRDYSGDAGPLPADSPNQVAACGVFLSQRLREVAACA